MRKGKKLKLITPADKTGWLFVLPFAIGFIWFFALPLLDSLQYTFNIVKVGKDGMDLTFVGWDNYKTALQGDRGFYMGLIEQCTSMIVKVLVIMFMSMFCALLLNDKFPGRLLFRACLFLPVIFAADIIMEMLYGAGQVNEMSKMDSSYVLVSTEMTGFVKEIIESFGFLSKYIK